MRRTGTISSSSSEEMVPSSAGSAVSTSTSCPRCLSQLQTWAHITSYPPNDGGGYSRVTVRRRSCFSIGADSCSLIPRLSHSFGPPSVPRRRLPRLKEERLLAKGGSRAVSALGWHD